MTKGIIVAVHWRSLGYVAFDTRHSIIPSGTTYGGLWGTSLQPVDAWGIGKRLPGEVYERPLVTEFIQNQLKGHVMTIIAAQALDTTERGVIELSAMLAQGITSELVLCNVVSHRWFGLSPSRSDVAKTASLRADAAEALENASQDMPRGLDAVNQVRVARSIPVALHEEVIEREADLLVVGSRQDGIRGRISLGPVAKRVLYSTPVPLAIAPRGYLGPADAGPTRVTVAVDLGPNSFMILVAAARLALRLDVPLRLVTFAIQRKAILSAMRGSKTENEVVGTWSERAHAAQASLVGQLAPQIHNGEIADVAEALAINGQSWDHVVADLDWESGELLVMGSSSKPAVFRTLFGSDTTRLLRASKVPTIVVPTVRDSKNNDSHLLGMLGLPSAENPVENSEEG